MARFWFQPLVILLVAATAADAVLRKSRREVVERVGIEFSHVEDADPDASLDEQIRVYTRLRKTPESLAITLARGGAMLQYLKEFDTAQQDFASFRA